jgi:hypothetical protein
MERRSVNGIETGGNSPVSLQTGPCVPMEADSTDDQWLARSEFSSPRLDARTPQPIPQRTTMHAFSALERDRDSLWTLMDTTQSRQVLRGHLVLIVESRTVREANYLMVIWSIYPNQELAKGKTPNGSCLLTCIEDH